jgi:hypothetical protein
VLVDLRVEDLGVGGRCGQAVRGQGGAQDGEVFLDAVRLDLGEADVGEAGEGAGGIVGEGFSD